LPAHGQPLNIGGIPALRLIELPSDGQGRLIGYDFIWAILFYYSQYSCVPSCCSASQ